MTELVATAALSKNALVVAAESRPADVLTEAERVGASHAAVFDGDAFLGVVAFRSILGTSPQRIFADLVRQSRVPAALSSAPVSELISLMQSAKADAVALLSEGSSFAGVVTCESIRAAMQAQERGRWQQIERAQSGQERLRMLGQMAAAVAHDLNNALTPIIGYLELLTAEEQLPETSRQRAIPALTAAQDAAAVVRRLQQFYRPRPDRCEAVTVDLVQLLEEIRVLARPKWRDEAQHRGRRIEVLVQPGDGGAVIGRPAELREALLNLVFNAVDAVAKDGRITLRATRRDPDGAALLEVIDNGGGMDQEQLSRCFEPFYTTKGCAGTGLGLTVVREIVESHGGSVEVETVPGAGTTFRLRLPAAERRDANAQAELERSSRASCSVLYVDDDSRLHPPVQAMLRRLGHRPEVATSAAAALALMEGRVYDIVVTDLTMPGLGGDELVRMLRPRAPQAAFVLTSGWDRAELTAGLRSVEGPDAVLYKPFSIRELEQALQAALSARRGLS